jgi:simple sugar transport system permease protein
MDRIMRAVRPVAGPIAAIAVTLAIGYLIVLAVTDEPVKAYQQLFFANFKSLKNFSLFLNRATPLVLIALGVVFAFRAGVFNVGGEGQLYLGAISTTAMALLLAPLPGPLNAAISIAAGVAAGAFWSWIPGELKVRLGVDEVVSTLMLNFIALLITGYLADKPLRDLTAYGAVSYLTPEGAWLPSIPGLPNATSGFLVCVVLAILSWLVLFRTEWGANLRAAGTNLRFAEAIGIRAKKEIVLAMVVSGAFAGLAGALYVLGIGHRFEQNFSPAYGLIGLTVALLARVHPIGALATGLFYALILNGAAYMQIATDVPRSLVNLLAGLLVLTMTARLRRPAATAG